MGKFNGKGDPDGRPGVNKKKKAKEQRMGRLVQASQTNQKVVDIKNKLDEFSQYDGNHQYSLQFANLISSCDDQVALPSEMNSIVSYSSFFTNDGKKILKNGGEKYGKYHNQLPLYHLAKILNKNTSETTKQDINYVYILQNQNLNTWDEKNIDLEEYNLRALEIFLSTFSDRLKKGKELSVVIENSKLTLPFETSIKVCRDELKKINTSLSESYVLQRVSEGGNRLGNNIEIVSEVLKINDEYVKGQTSNLYLSYLRV